MKSPGILGTVRLAATLVFAIPVALFGVGEAVSGDLLVGGAFLVLAALMVIVQEYLTTPSDVPAEVAERAAGRLVDDDSEK